MKRFTWKTLFLITLLPAPLTLAFCGKKETKLKPSFRELTEAVYASGNIYPRNEYKVFANADGFLTERLVNPGDTVWPGRLMFHIESDIQGIRSEAASRIYHKALENYSDRSPALQELLIVKESAFEKMQNDSINYIRYKKLYESDAVSGVNYERAKLTYNLSRNDYYQKNDSYRKLKNQLFIELQNAESNYLVSAKDLGNYMVKSNIGGMVYDVFREKGEAVRRNEPIAIVGDAENVYLQLQVDELDIPRIKIGQEILVKLDIYRDQVYRAKVTKIYPRLNKSDQSFRVDAEFSGARPKIYYGLTAEANIIVSKRSKVLTLPRNAFARGDSVWVKKDGEEEKVAVKKGVENFDYVEVMGGIDENTEVIIKEKGK